MLRCGSLPARAVKMKTHYIESGVLYVLVFHVSGNGNLLSMQRTKEKMKEKTAKSERSVEHIPVLSLWFCVCRSQHEIMHRWFHIFCHNFAIHIFLRYFLAIFAVFSKANSFSIHILVPSPFMKMRFFLLRFVIIYSIVSHFPFILLYIFLLQCKDSFLSVSWGKLWGFVTEFRAIFMQLRFIFRSEI